MGTSTSSDLTGRVAVGAFLVSCLARKLSPRTLEHYRWALQPLARGGPAPTRPEELEELLGGLPGGRETRRCYFRVWRAFYRWAGRRYSLPYPLGEISPPQRSRRAPPGLDQVQVLAVLDRALGRERSLVALLLDTGIRLGEAAGLRPGDVGPQGVRVDGKTGPREVPISPWVRELVLPWLPWGVGAKSLYLAVRRALARAGVSGPRCGPHLLRHTFARLYILAGGDPFSLQIILGHASLTTTQVYVALSPREVLLQHGRFSSLAGRPASDLAPAVDQAVREALGPRGVKGASDRRAG